MRPDNRELRLTFEPGIKEPTSALFRLKGREGVAFAVVIDGPIDKPVLEAANEVVSIMLGDFELGPNSPQSREHPLYQHFDGPGIIAHRNNEVARVNGG